VRSSGKTDAKPFTKANHESFFNQHKNLNQFSSTFHAKDIFSAKEKLHHPSIYSVFKLLFRVAEQHGKFISQFFYLSTIFMHPT
jgi:hypothetical protein